MNKHRHSLARLRVFVAMLCLIFLAAGAFAAEPLKLVTATSGYYSTSIVLSAKADASEAVTVDVGDCVVGPSPLARSIEPAGADVLRNVGQYLCGGPFVLLDAPADVDAISVISFRHGNDRSSFAVPPIGAIERKTKLLGPLVSDDVEGAWITTFPTVETPLRAIVYDGRHLFVPLVEVFDAQPPVAQYRIQTEGVLFVEVEIFSFGVPFPPLYGFASTGSPDGGTFRAFPFGE